MRTSQYLLSTLKEAPCEVKIISHQLMLRSGMIRKTSSGVYIWLPTGMRVLKKIRNIVHHEMQKINGLEMSIPILQSESLWEKTGRLDIYGEELLKFLDRRKNKFILSPTNEEIVANFIKNEIHSYKNLPLIVYQIQTKFRDEIRPRFGIIRAREFIMKDAYSFHGSQDCLNTTYDKLYEIYKNIFKKMQLDFCIVKADSGVMGGNISHEFQSFSKNGEDEVVFSDDKLYSTNMNMAYSKETVDFLNRKNKHKDFLKPEKTHKSTVNTEQLNQPVRNFIKTFFVRAKKEYNSSIIALLICENHELNLFKLEKIDILHKPIIFLDEQEVISLSGAKKAFSGPCGLKIPIIADISAYKMKDFSIGSNIDNHFFINVNWKIDLPVPIIKDIRKVTKKDLSPYGRGYLNIKRSIEIGHIFQLGQKYSQKMNASIQIKNGNQENLHMGCYGIGITRLVAALVEQNHDKNGIIWPNSVAPFEVIILPINMYKFVSIKKIANILYQKLKIKGIDVILDDRNEQPGIMFNESDLIGIPYQIIISKRSLQKESVEYRTRKDKKSILVNINNITNFIIEKLKQ